MSPLVSILALAMPAMTLHILFAPAVNAVGTAPISIQAALVGAPVMPLAFVVGSLGRVGVGWAWLVAFPLVPLFAFLRSRKIIGITAAQLAAAVAPGSAAARRWPFRSRRSATLPASGNRGPGWRCKSALAG